MLAAAAAAAAASDAKADGDAEPKKRAPSMHSRSVALPTVPGATFVAIERVFDARTKLDIHGGPPRRIGP